MDKEQQEMQFMGVFGIYKESYNIILTCPKIFTKITLFLIFPLSYYYWIAGLARTTQIDLVGYTLFIYNEANKTSPDRLSSMYWAAFKAVDFAILLAFSLLSTAAVVYTVASVYTARTTVTFKEVRIATGVVFKRLIVTLLCILPAMFVYHLLALLVLLLWPFTSAALPALVMVSALAYASGFAYLTIIWQLASVVTVLEEASGFGAMRRSVELIRGKRLVSIVVFLTLYLASGAIQVALEKLDGVFLTFGVRAVYTVICYLLLSVLVLFQVVVQIVIYFVCKSCHHESIDKSDLSDHLEIYLQEYVPLKSKDVLREHLSA